LTNRSRLDHLFGTLGMPIALAFRVFPLLLISLFAVLAIAAPDSLFVLGQVAVIATAGLLAFVFPTTVLTIAVVSLTFSPENLMIFDRLNLPMNVGAVHKFLVLLATVPMVLRYGVNWRINGPLIAILLLLATSLVFGDVHPALTQFQIVKSLIALLIPWLFLSVKFNDKTADALLIGIALMPTISVLAAIPVEMIGALNRIGEPLTMIAVDYTGGARLTGMNFPAFLAFFGYVSFLVCLHKVVIENRRGFIFLALVNLAMIILSGTRMPSLLAVLLAGLMIFFASKETLKGAAKINLFLLGLVFVSVVMVFYWPQLEARMFAQTSDSAVNLSGRDEIWSYFLAAFYESPVFGKGVGAGVVLLEDVVIYSSHAAHNEYLRLLVDGGVVGLLLYIGGVVVHMAIIAKHLTRDEKVLIFGFFFLLAIYSLTDNALTAPPTLVMGLVIAIFLQKARLKHTERTGSDEQSDTADAATG